jgi:hypothetical protein
MCGEIGVTLEGRARTGMTVTKSPLVSELSERLHDGHHAAQRRVVCLDELSGVQVARK